MSIPKKFPALYNIIKKDDVSILNEYFQENPNYDIFKSLSYTGYHIYYHSIDLSSIQCFKYLTDLMDLETLKGVAGDVVYHYKKDQQIFNYYYDVVRNKCEQENNYNPINKIVINIVKYNQNIYKNLFDKVISEYDFVAQFQNSIFKKNLENVIVENKSLWINYFEKFYRDNNISRDNLFAKCLIFSKFDTDKYLKLFKNMDYSQKIRIEGKIDCWDFHHMSKHEYTLEFIICITCPNQDISNFKICTENKIEDELLNLFSEADDKSVIYNSFLNFKNGNNIIFYELMETINKYKPFAEYAHLIKPEYHEHLLKMIPYVSERFVNLMKTHLSYEGFDIDEFKKKYFSHSSKPDCVKNSRILLKRIIDEFEKVHNLN